MSVGTVTVRARNRLAWPRVRLGTAAVPVGAFLVSRLLVVATGAIGAATTTPHSGVAAAALHRALGPVGFALAGSVDRFDAAFYLSIAQHGYGPAAAGHLAFFPLYPLLIRAVSTVLVPAAVSGFLVSATALLVALILVHRLTELELGRAAADATVVLLAYAPLSFFFTAIYSEALFLALTVGAVYAARTDRWRLACALGAAAALTRPTGILVALAVVTVGIQAHGRRDRRLLGVLAIPAVLGGYLVGLTTQGYSILAPFTAQTGWQRTMTGPVIGVAAGAWSALRGVGHLLSGEAIYRPTLYGPFTPDALSVVLFAVLVIAVAATIACWRRLPAAYGVYSVAVLAVCLSSPESGQPLWSLDRFVLTLFPLWMVAGAWIARRRAMRPVLALSVLALVFYTLQFSSWAFVA